MKHRIKKSILVLFDDLPSREKPDTYINPLAEAIELSKECNITIVSPVCLAISLTRYKENKERIRKLPPYKYNIKSVPCWRPRYISTSLIPWKYNVHYFQIWALILSLILLILSRRIHFDMIATSFVYRPGYVAAILGKLFGKPVIIHALGTDIHQNLFSNKEDGLIRKRTISTMRWCTKIIAVSKFLANQISMEGFGDKTDVNPRGYSEKLFFPRDRIECRKKLSLPIEKKLLIAIGRLVLVKGMDILIEAFKILSADHDNMDLIIIGDGPEKEALIRRVCQMGLEERVFFLGSKAHATIPLYINACDILVVSCRNEGLSLVTIQALACGRPVVASRVGGIPETIVNDKLGILVEKENTAALANGIMKALMYLWDRKYISNHAKKYAQDRLALRLLKIYDNVLSRM